MSTHARRLTATALGIGLLFSVPAVAQAAPAAPDSATAVAVAERKPQPRIQVTNPTTRFGEVTVTGTRLPRRAEVTVLISSGSAVYARTTAFVDRRGRLDVTLTPFEAWHQGSYEVWVATPGGNPVTTTLTITADLPHVSDATVTSTVPTTPTDAITITGAGFPPNTSTRVFVNQRLTSVVPIETTVMTDAEGGFTLTATPAQGAAWIPNTRYLVSAPDGTGQSVEFEFTTGALT